MKRKHWNVKASRYVHRDAWIAVRADDCETPEGVAVAPYYVLEYPDWVFVSVFDDDDRVMLVHLYRHGMKEMSLELPGGVKDEADASPVDTAQRELLEETGYTAATVVHVGSMTPNSATHTNLVHSCVALGAKRVGPPAQDDTEDIEVEFVEVEDLLEMIDDGRFKQALHIAAFYRALRYRKMLKMMQGA
jgi:8-oxo-dGTP pyrophosphatase MutT (NUDIX family)